MSAKYTIAIVFDNGQKWQYRNITLGIVECLLDGNKIPLDNQIWLKHKPEDIVCIKIYPK